MPTNRPFVGREKELADLEQAIAREEGQLLLVVGGTGFGKTALLEELNRRVSRNEARFSLLYRLNRNDTSEAFLPRLAQDLLNIDDLSRRRLVLGAPGRKEQWKALVGAIPAVGKLAESLVPEEKRFAREILLNFLVAVAKLLKADQRLVLIFDPDEYLDQSVEADWASLMRDLPPRVSIMFAQRPDDCLAHSEALLRAPNSQRVPQQPLGHLTRENNAELVKEYWQQTPTWKALSATPPGELADILWAKYQGYALAITMALDDLPKPPLSLEQLLELARDLPVPYQRLLERRYDEAVTLGGDAVRLLHGLAVLGRPATCSRVAALYADEQVTSGALLSISRRREVARCLAPAEQGGLALFHSTMAECILGSLSEDDKKALHRRAAALYSADLEQDPSDSTALDLLPYHLHRSGDVRAFLDGAMRVASQKHTLGLFTSYRRDLTLAVPICRALAARDGAFTGYLAGFLNDLGEVLRTVGERVEAERHLAEAVTIYRELAASQPSIYEPRLATALSNLANVLAAAESFSQARERYEEALCICRRLAEVAPATHRSLLAMVLCNLGNLLGDVGERAKAREHLEEALVMSRQLAEAEPDTFDSRVALVANNLGTVLRDLCQPREALCYLQEALAIRRRLADGRRAGRDTDLAVTLNNLGGVLKDLEDRAGAKGALEEALGICMQSARQEPGAFLPDLLLVAQNGLSLAAEMGEDPKSWPNLQAALEVIERLKPGIGRPGDEWPGEPGSHG